MFGQASKHRFWAAVFAVTLLTLGLTAGGPAQADGGYLGVHLQELDDALVEAFDLGEDAAGVLVSDVVDDSPAEAAGLQRGDVITHINDVSVRSPRSLSRKVGRADVGDEVVIAYLRKGESGEVTVTIGEKPESNVFTLESDAFFMEAGQPRLGVRVEEVGEELGRYFGTDTGVLVLEVHEDSAAEDAGVQVGDVLVELAGEPVENVMDLREVLAEYDEGDELTLELLRDSNRQSVEVEVREPERVEIGNFMRGQTPNVFRLDGDDFPRGSWRGRMGNAPHGMHFDVREFGDDDDLEAEMEELREQLKKLTEEVERLKDR